MHVSSHPSPSTSPPRRRRTLRRKSRLLVARLRRGRWRITRRLVLFSGWIWVGAVSLVGFEMFDIVFGTFLLAPEFLPIVLTFMALAWYFRERLKPVWARLLVRLRLLRGRRRGVAADRPD